MKKETYYIKIEVDIAPSNQDSKAFIDYCEKYGFSWIGSGRGAWCPQFSTYFRGAYGVANNEGDSFLVYEEDLMTLDQVKEL